MSDMITVQVKGVDFAKVIRNVILWQDQDVRLTQGKALLSFSATELSMYSCDGWTAVRDEVSYVPVEMTDTIEYLLTEDEMDTLLLAAVESKTGPLTLHVTAIALKLDYDVIPEDKDSKTKKSLKEGTIFLGERSTVPEWVDALEEALEYADQDSVESYPQDVFCLRPERFMKFVRVRADKEAPIDMKLLRPINPKAGPMAAVKIGFTFRGLVNFVNREVALENLTDEQKVFLWM